MGQKLSIVDANPVIHNANNSWVQSRTNPFDTGIIQGKPIMSNVNSIPSPYARMHLFEIAFQKMANGGNQPDDLKRCVSNCLDVFELFYDCKTETALRNAGLEVKLHRYKDVTDVVGNGQLADKEREYLEALGLFRKGYCDKYNEPSLFKVYFTLSKNSNLIAATSPFTGFYLREENDPEIVMVDYGGKKYFSPSENDSKTGELLWKPLNQRDPGFQEFMYKLINYLVNNVGGSFTNRYNSIWGYVCSQFTQAQMTAWNNINFADSYHEFGFAGIANTHSWGFPIRTENPKWQGQDVHVIPNSYDCLFLKYMLSPQDKASFELCKEDYIEDIAQRINPIDGSSMQWVSVDDFLDDRIVIIQGEINDEKYFVINGENNKNIIPPLKKRFFEFFKVEDLKGNGAGRVEFEMSKDDDTGTFYLTIKIPYINNAGNIDYLSLSKKYDVNHQVANNTIELGIFPFIKTPRNVDDFYRLVLYTNKEFKLNDMEIIQFNENKYIDYQTPTVLSQDGEYVRRKFTNGNNALSKALGTDLLYYSLESTFNRKVGENSVLMNHRDVSFDILNIKYTIENPAGNISCECIVVPFMEEIAQNDANVRIAIDFGTSNTFVAYSTADTPIEFETTNSSHCGDTLFVKFNKVDVNNPDRKDKYDFAKNKLTQRCEFIPAYFDTANGFKFPVPTILNVRGVLNTQLEDFSYGAVISAFDANIPFSYYDDGTRTLAGGNDIDRIKDNFKWIKATDRKSLGAVYLYLEELLLLLRSRILSQGINITGSQLYFTYPLSFDNPLLLQYKNILRLLYAKYFNLAIMPQNCGVEEVYQDIQQIIFDNESKTPLFSENAIVGAGHGTGRIISADIGGGSCDMMIYDIGENRLEKCFSFEFAGNDLFGSGRVQNKKNIWFKDVAPLNKKDVEEQATTPVSQKRVSAKPDDFDIINLINSLFTNNPNYVDTKIAESDRCKFVTLLFSCAIFYQMADICRASGVCPDKVFFSGNGSKLLNMQQNQDNFETTDCNDKLLRIIFSNLMPDNKPFFNGGAFSIVNNTHPKKAATAFGILKAANLGFAGEAITEHWISYGEHTRNLYRQLDPGAQNNPNDEPTPLDIGALRNDFESEERSIYLSVRENVEDYFTILFKDILPRIGNLSAKYAYEEVDDSIVNGKTNIYYILKQFDSIQRGYSDAINSASPGLYYDSLFLKVMSRIISDLCQAL